MIDRITRIDISNVTAKKFFELYQKTRTPVIITGLIESNLDWNLNYLCEQFGEQELLFRNYGKKRYEQEKHQWKNIGSGVELQTMSFREYAELLQNHQAHKDDINLGKYPLHKTPLTETESLKKVGNKLGLIKPASDLNIYVAPGGHKSGLHYDALDSTLMQLHGSKKLIFFPPSQTYNLYPFPIYKHLRYGLKLRSWFSQISIEKPNFKLFPKFKEALSYKHEVILHQSEVIYIPAGWWHDVISLGDEMVCAVNRFWRVYPTSRALLSWNRWRSGLGILSAIPYNLLSVAIALSSSSKKQNLSKIAHRL